MPRRKPSPSRWRWSLVPLAIVLLTLVALVDLMVVRPKRRAEAQEARRSAPAKLVPPSVMRWKAEAAGEDPRREDRKVLTAFRAEEWRIDQPVAVGVGDAADHYLSGYMSVREAEKLLEAGKPEEARAMYEVAVEVFNRIGRQQPSFEPEMIEFRRKKIVEAMAALEKGVP